MNKNDAERVIEALLFTSSEPLSINGLKKKLPHSVDIGAVIETLQKHYEKRGINLKRVGGAIVFRTAKDLHHLFITKEVTKLEIEEIRGVSVGSGTIDLLIDLDWIKFGRRKSSPGRPITFQITDKFLDYFDLSSEKDLPGVKELRDLGLSVKKLNRA